MTHFLYEKEHRSVTEDLGRRLAEITSENLKRTMVAALREVDEALLGIERETVNCTGVIPSTLYLQQRKLVTLFSDLLVRRFPWLSRLQVRFNCFSIHPFSGVEDLS